MEKSTRFARFETALGQCAVSYHHRSICGVFLPESSPRALAKRVLERAPDAVESEPSELAKGAIAALREAAEGKTTEALLALPLELSGVPDFYRRASVQAQKIPVGETLTYGDLAERAGAKGGARAAGQAMRENRFPLVVPCHRVVAAGGGLGGFSAGGGLSTKLKLLAAEREAQRAKKHSLALPYDLARAREHLSASDPLLKPWIARVGECMLARAPTESVFAALTEAIVYQQLSGRAARTIFLRLWALDGLAPTGLRAESLARMSEKKLQSAGISSAKSLAIQELAQRARDGKLRTLQALGDMEDEAIVDELIALRGIGRWTVEMFLMFRLGRPDVLPLDDLGVRKGLGALLKREGPVEKAELAAHGARWAPYRSVASWYLWRASELA